MSIYRPIIKLKLNDVQALNLVHDSLVPEISPIFEMLLPLVDADLDRHLVSALDAFHSYKQKTVPAVDLTMFQPGTVLGGELAAVAGYRNLYQRNRRVIPVFSNALEDDLWNGMREMVTLHGQGVCFRLSADDTAMPSLTKAWLAKRMGELQVTAEQSDLLLDFGKLGAQDDEEVVVNSAVLLRELEREGFTFRSVTMSGSSLVDFVTEIVPIEDEEADLPRREFGNWLRTNALLGWLRPIAYSDYGIVRPGHVDKTPNPYINGKVRYTWGRHTRYFRGCRRTKTKLAVQYTGIAKRVVNSSVYRGANFSAGDTFLDAVARRGRISGDPGEWVWIDMNHHLHFVALQTRALLNLVSQGRRNVEELEKFAEAF